MSFEHEPHPQEVVILDGSIHSLSLDEIFHQLREPLDRMGFEIYESENVPGDNTRTTLEIMSSDDSEQLAAIALVDGRPRLALHSGKTLPKALESLARQLA